jgi:hypothetical protein
LIIVVSTVALREEVPAKGKSENATFPSGHNMDAESAGEGTANAVVDGDNDDAKVGDVGMIKFEAIIPAIPCTALRLPMVVPVEVDLGLSTTEESWLSTDELSDSR